VKKLGIERTGGTMFDKVTETNLLYDFYSPLLTNRQREVTRLYHCENLSLSEIGCELSISRQGVYDSLKNAEKALEEYESKLGLVQRFACTATLVRSAHERIDAMIMDNAANKELTGQLCSLKETIDELGQ